MDGVANYITNSTLGVNERKNLINDYENNRSENTRCEFDDTSNEDVQGMSHLLKQIEEILSDDSDEEKKFDQKLLQSLKFNDSLESRSPEEDIKEAEEIFRIAKLRNELSYLKLQDTKVSSKEKNKEGWKEVKNGGKYGLITKRIDTNKIRHKAAKNMEIYSSLLRNVKLEDDGAIRSGAIIYTRYKGETYFCLGVDSTYGDLTDFGGGCRKGETIIEGGLRELEEESLGIFGTITPKEILDSMAFYTSNMIIIFIHRSVDMEATKREFLARKKVKEEEGITLEVSNICWLSSKEFMDIIAGKGRRLYSRVKRILSKTVEIIAEL